MQVSLATRARGLWLGTRTGAGGTATLTKGFVFWPQLMASWTIGRKLQVTGAILGASGH